MELDKKKYKAEEVQSLLDELKTEYNGKLAERNEEIFELNGKLKRMRAELESFKNRDSLISSSLQAAEEQAEKSGRPSGCSMNSRSRGSTIFS